MKNLKFLALTVFCSTMFTSCLVDDTDETLEAVANTPYTIGFSQQVANESYFEDIGPIEAGYNVVVIGGQDGSDPSQDITVSYTVNTELSSATEGVEFDFVDNSGSLTIPAGSDFGRFNLLINTGGLNETMPTRLVLDLTAADSTGAPAVVAASNSRIAITFVGCNSQLAQEDNNFTNYFMQLTREDGSSVSRNEVIEWVAPNQFLTESTGVWGINSIAPDTSMNFEVICGEVFVPNQGLCQGFYSNEVYGVNLDGPDGLVDLETLNFDMSYIITFGSGPLRHDVTYTRL